MNNKVLSFAGILLIFFVMTTFGFNRSYKLDVTTKKAAIKNLLAGLNSDNFGLRTSSAFELGELKADEAVIPLLKMLKSDANEDARIVAALALFKINDSRGIFAVKQAIKFDENERVRKMCTNFYIQSVFDKNSSVDNNEITEVALK